MKFFDRISKTYWLITYSRYRKIYALDEKFRFNGKFIQLYGEGNINVGPESYVGELSNLQAAKGYSIKIGASCQISHNVRVYTQSAIADCDFSLDDMPKNMAAWNLATIVGLEQMYL